MKKLAAFTATLGIAIGIAACSGGALTYESFVSKIVSVRELIAKNPTNPVIDLRGQDVGYQVESNQDLSRVTLLCPNGGTANLEQWIAKQSNRLSRELTGRTDGFILISGRVPPDDGTTPPPPPPPPTCPAGCSLCPDGACICTGCGNGLCENGETCSSCSRDCGQCDTCGGVARTTSTGKYACP